MLQDINAVLFDLDGTLVDSMWIWRDIDIEYLARFNLTLPDALQKEIEGMSFTETAVYFKNRFDLEDSLEQIKNDWNRMAEYKYKHEVPLKEGALEFLKYLKQNQIQTGIASSNSKELVELVIKKHGVYDYFKSIRTSCEVEKGKPSPDIYLLVSNDLGVSSKQCLVFEDVIQGVKAGKNAGMKVCAVYDDFSAKDTKKKKEIADYYINSFKELLL